MARRRKTHGKPVTLPQKEEKEEEDMKKVALFIAQDSKLLQC